MTEPNGAQNAQPGVKVPASENAPSAEVKALTDMVKGLTEQVKTLQAQQNQVFSPQFIQSLRGPAQETAPEPEVDLNDMDNVGVAQHIVGKVAALLDNRLGEVKKDLNVVRAGQSLSDMRARHGDFDNYLPQMRELWKKNPGLGPEEAYRLTKFGNDDAVNAAIEAEKARDREAAIAAGQTQPPGVGSSFNMEDHQDLSADEKIALAAEEILKSF